MTTKIMVYKADPITYSEPVNGVTIEIQKDLPDGGTLNDSRRLYGGDAEKIFSALKANLPQGTRYRLMLLLLQDSENLYRGL